MTFDKNKPFRMRSIKLTNPEIIHELKDGRLVVAYALDGVRRVETLNADGTLILGEETAFDLINIPETIEVDFRVTVNADGKPVGFAGSELEAQTRVASAWTCHAGYIHVKGQYEVKR